MKIIIVDRLNYPFGGTQKYVFSLAQLLKENLNEVHIFDGQKIITDFDQNNFSFNQPKPSLLQKLESIYSVSIFFKSYFIFKKNRPDIIHLNNINYLITPSIIHAAKILKIPVVAHLHDYKLVCAKSTLLNNTGQHCHQCQNQKYFSILKNGCTRNNKKNIFENLYLYFENISHNKILKIHKNIDCFISPSQFLKNTFIEMGFPYHIEVIPNFSSFTPPSLSKKSSSKKNKILYFGRLSHEKGLINLCRSVKNLPVFLTIIGSGPLQKKLKSISQKQKNIKVLPFKKEKELLKIISKNDCTIVPSIWPENASISIIESLSQGKPIIGSRIGGNTEMIQNNQTGWLFDPNNFDSLKNIFLQLQHNKDNHPVMLGQQHSLLMKLS